MNQKIAACLLAMMPGLVACASLRRPGPLVDVYEAPASASPGERRLPEGCRLLATSVPIDQMERERAISDPYRRERAVVAQEGGNVLLVLSQRTVTRPNLDCPSGDATADCLSSGQSWYRVSFEHYACTPEAEASLRKLPPPERTGGITVLLSAPKKPAPPAATPSKPQPAAAAATPSPLAPPELKAKIVNMMKENVAPGVILAYVRGQTLSRKMTAEEIIDWTKSGIPDAVIEAAAR